MPVRLDHVLVALILFVLPLRAWWGMRALNAAPAETVPGLRRRLWARALATQWLITALIGYVWWSEHRSPVSLSLVLRPTMGLVGVLVGLVTIVSLVVRQRARIAQEPELQVSVREQLASVSRLMPHSDAEFAGFAALAVTAGVCEEVMFRGFLTWYLAHFLPLPAAAAVQIAVFGLAHLYQGRSGILKTGLVGAFFTGLVWVSGSLFPAMLIHALMDLHAGDLARRMHVQGWGVRTPR
jgi:uncharacterized protein